MRCPDISVAVNVAVELEVRGFVVTKRLGAGRRPNVHWLALGSLALLGVVPFVSNPSSAAGTTEPASEGRIVFGREESDLYTVNPDGSDLQLLTEDAIMGTWSPDGAEISVFC